MRKLLMAVLLAGAASPALAQPVDEGDDRPTRAERTARAERAEPRPDRQAEPRQSRPERAQRNIEVRGFEVSGDDLVRPGRTRPSANVRPSPAIEQQVLETRPSETPGERAQRRVAREQLRGGADAGAGLVEQRQRETPGERAQRRVAGDTVRDWRARERLVDRPDSPALVQERNLRRRGEVEDSAPSSVQPREVRPTIAEGPRIGGGGVRPAVIESPGSDLVQPSRPLPRTMDPERRRRVTTTPTFGAEPPAPASALTGVATTQHRWRNDWHRDGRYDWRDWRSRHRSLFRLGFYYDPFGWNYFRYGIGWRLWPSYYRSSFWLSDPWMYRLPRTWGPYRWIRYHNDALLVNLYTGEVEDVVYDFFW